MRDLLKRRFEAFVRMRWIKEIEKSTDEYKIAFRKCERKRYVLYALVKAYKEKYGEDLMGGDYGK
jgi:hypothetical protein